jgi:hypothetical protein
MCNYDLLEKDNPLSLPFQRRQVFAVHNSQDASA